MKGLYNLCNYVILTDMVTKGHVIVIKVLNTKIFILKILTRCTDGNV